MNSRRYGYILVRLDWPKCFLDGCSLSALLFFCDALNLNTHQFGLIENHVLTVQKYICGLMTDVGLKDAEDALCTITLRKSIHTYK